MSCRGDKGDEDEDEIATFSSSEALSSTETKEEEMTCDDEDAVPGVNDAGCACDVAAAGRMPSSSLSPELWLEISNKDDSLSLLLLLLLLLRRMDDIFSSVRQVSKSSEHLIIMTALDHLDAFHHQQDQLSRVWCWGLDDSKISPKLLAVISGGTP